MHKAQGAVQRCVLCHIPCLVAQLPPVTLLGNNCTATANSSQAPLAGSWPCRGWGVPGSQKGGTMVHGSPMMGRKRPCYRVVAPDTIPDQQPLIQSGNSARRLTVLYVFTFQVVCATIVAYTVSCVYTQHPAWANLGCLPQTSRKHGLDCDKHSSMLCLTQQTCTNCGMVLLNCS